MKGVVAQGEGGEACGQDHDGDAQRNGWIVEVINYTRFYSMLLIMILRLQMVIRFLRVSLVILIPPFLTYF